MENGQEERVTFELTDDEKHFVAHTHGRHLGCELAKCNLHQMVHLIIRLEAGRRKLEHELEAMEDDRDIVAGRGTGTHGVNGICERCKWKDVDWLTNMAGEWGHP
jgi:hypothetical protein